MIKNFLNFVYLFLLVFVFACEKSEIETTQPDNKNNVDSTINNVSKETAVIVANNFQTLMKINPEGRRKKMTIEKTVMETFEVKTANGENAFYVINYNEGGYVIVSGDNRMSPIRTFSDEGRFSPNNSDIPDPVVYWKETEKDAVQYLDSSTLTATTAVQYEWNYLLQIIGNPNLCENIAVIKGPLLQTTWSQGATFNNLINFTCPTKSGGRAPVGCVATAMGQVMKFHQYPTNYNWNAMPNSYGTLQTQQLLYNIGGSVGMNYGCNGSGANSNNIGSAFTDIFGYANANYGDYNADFVINNLNVNKPVILTGGRVKDGLSFNQYADGHAWVCDGYYVWFLRSWQPNGTCGVYPLRFLHMNWGWGDIPENSWYAENNFNPLNNSYNFQRKMIYNIVP